MKVQIGFFLSYIYIFAQDKPPSTVTPACGWAPLDFFSFITIPIANRISSIYIYIYTYKIFLTRTNLYTVNKKKFQELHGTLVHY